MFISRNTSFIYLIFILNCHDSCSSILRVPALGRTTTFGDLYDARTNQLTGINIFKKQLNSSFIERIHAPHTTEKYSYTSKELEKLDELNIDGSIKIQIITQSLDVNGAAKYAKNEHYKNKEIQYNYIIKSKTCEERVNWRLEDLNDYYDFNEVGQYGTHVVIGIEYGGNAVLTMFQKQDETSNAQSIKSHLKGIWGADGEFNTSSKCSITFDHIEVETAADVLVETDDIKEMHGEIKFKKNFQKKLSEINNGKGVQIILHLISLKAITDHFKISLAKSLPYRDLTKANVTTVMGHLENVEKLKQDIIDEYMILEKDKIYFSKNQQKLWRQEKLLFDKAVDNIHDGIGAALIKFHESIAAADSLFKEQEERIFDLEQMVIKFNEKFSTFHQKMIYISNAVENNAIHVFSINELTRLKLNHQTMTLYLFSSIYKDYIELFKFFSHESKTTASASQIFLIVNVDILEDEVENEIHFKELHGYPLYKYYEGQYWAIKHVPYDTKNVEMIPLFVPSIIYYVEKSPQFVSPESSFYMPTLFEKNKKLPHSVGPYSLLATADNKTTYELLVFQINEEGIEKINLFSISCSNIKKGKVIATMNATFTEYGILQIQISDQQEELQTFEKSYVKRQPKQLLIK